MLYVIYYFANVIDDYVEVPARIPDIEYSGQSPPPLAVSTLSDAIISL